MSEQPEDPNEQQQPQDWAVEGEDLLEPEDSLAAPQGSDPMDGPLSPPDESSPLQYRENTPSEIAEGESLEEKLSEEAPEPEPDAESAPERDPASAPTAQLDESVDSVDSGDPLPEGRSAEQDARAEIEQELGTQEQQRGF